MKHGRSCDIQIMTNLGCKCRTRGVPTCNIFNLGSSYSNVALSLPCIICVISYRRVQSWSAGIVGQWVDTWRPRDDTDTELGLILEDDISVSPYAYRWLRAVHRAYRHRSDFVGSSLTSDQMSIVSDRRKGPLAAPKNDTILMYKCLGSWGFAPRPLHWRRFQVTENQFDKPHTTCC